MPGNRVIDFGRRPSSPEITPAVPGNKPPTPRSRSSTPENSSTTPTRPPTPESGYEFKVTDYKLQYREKKCGQIAKQLLKLRKDIVQQVYHFFEECPEYIDALCNLGQSAAVGLQVKGGFDHNVPLVAGGLGIWSGFEALKVASVCINLSKRRRQDLILHGAMFPKHGQGSQGSSGRNSPSSSHEQTSKDSLQLGPFRHPLDHVTRKRSPVGLRKRQHSTRGIYNGT